MEEEACFIYAIEGNSTIYGAGTQANIETDESVLMKCGNYLNYWKKNTLAKQSYEAIAVHFYPDVLRLVFEHSVPEFIQSKSDQPAASFQTINKQETIKQYIEGLLFYFKNPTLATDTLVKIKLKELIVLLHQLNNPGIRAILSDLFNPEQIAFKEIINAYLLEDLSVEDYAQLTNLSLSSFKRTFKKVFQESPGRYIKHKRLEKAAELLKVSNQRITDVCYSCGFNDLGHFSKSFTAKYGHSPSAYQKMYLD